jgi:hypothetical protein
MKTLRRLASACLLAGMLGGCGDDKSSTDGDGESKTADGGVAPEAAAPGGPIPLLLWVDDLIDHHSSEASLPDTVHDKNISDNEDATSFGKYFPK